MCRGAKLSRPIRSWKDTDAAGKGRARSHCTRRDGPGARRRLARGKKLRLKARAGDLLLEPGKTATVAELGDAPATLRALEFSVPREQAIEFGRAWLRIVWDGSPHASVDAPVALFFGAGTLYNRDNREYLVKAFPVNVRFDARGRASGLLLPHALLPFRALSKC